MEKIGKKELEIVLRQLESMTAYSCDNSLSNEQLEINRAIEGIKKYLIHINNPLT